MTKHALIVGASGIAGFQLAKLLLAEGDWKVSGIERRRRDYLDEAKGFNVISCDLLAPADEVRRTLAPVTKDVTHLIFVTWVDRPTEEERVKVNKTIFKTLIDTVSESSNCLEHIYLQTGSKYYGMHVGPEKGMVTPCLEDNPRIGPNFYYDLEDYLVQLATQKKIPWNVARPPCIIGFTVDTAMNLGVSFAVYASVMKELGKPLIFPYGQKAFHAFRELADNRLVSRFIFWLGNNNYPQNKNQAFNVTNGDLYRMYQLWNKIADYFGMEVKVTHDTNFNLTNFMNENKEVWNRIVDRHGLHKYDINSLGTWDFMQQMLNRDWDEDLVINKSLKYGWTERLDTLDCLESFFDRLRLGNIIPPGEKQLPHGTEGRPSTGSRA